MVRAELRWLDSTDVGERLQDHVPPNPDSFGYLISAGIGPAGEPGEDTFDFEVCSPRWLADHPPVEGYRWGRHLLILPRWDYALLVHAITRLCDAAHGPDWPTVAARIGRYGHWEFEDYDESLRVAGAVG